MKKKGIEMLATQHFLKSYGNDLVKLEEQYGIRSKVYPEHNIVVLNYDQISSPKYDPITRECRSLVLDLDWNVVSRSFMDVLS